MLKELLKPEIEDLIEEEQWDDIRDTLILWQEVETADLITSLKSEYKYKSFSRINGYRPAENNRKYERKRYCRIA